MNPNEHQEAAEALLRQAADTADHETAGLLVARAHVHALLASRASWTPPPKAFTAAGQDLDSPPETGAADSVDSVFRHQPNWRYALGDGDE